MTKIILKITILIHIFTGIALAKELSFTEQASLPPFVHELFSKQKIYTKYEFSSHVNPFFVQGDFDGDHQLDLAVLLIEKPSGKKGIAIFHRGTKKVTIIGAGKPLGNGGDDFNWLDAWYVYPKRKVAKGVDDTNPPKLRGDAIFVEKTESASAVLYWDGGNYRWYQQGD
jgi:hypothetical protein